MITESECRRRFLEDCEVRNLSTKTISLYRWFMGKFFIFEEVVLLNTFHHELQDPKKLEADVARLKQEIAKLQNPLNK